MIACRSLARAAARLMALTLSVGGAVAQSVEFSDGVSAAPEDGSVAEVRVVLSGPQAQDVSVQYSLRGRAVLGTDYDDAGSGLLVIPAGAVEAPILLTLIEDGLFERDETLELSLTSTSVGTIGATQRHVLTLVEDGPAPAVSFGLPAGTVQEGGGAGDAAHIERACGHAPAGHGGATRHPRSGGVRTGWAERGHVSTRTNDSCGPGHRDRRPTRRG